jgi:hypothetical protein
MNRPPTRHHRHADVVVAPKWSAVLHLKVVAVRYVPIEDTCCELVMTHHQHSEVLVVLQYYVIRQML